MRLMGGVGNSGTDLGHLINVSRPWALWCLEHLV